MRRDLTGSSRIIEIRAWVREVCDLEFSSPAGSLVVPATEASREQADRPTLIDRHNEIAVTDDLFRHAAVLAQCVPITIGRNPRRRVYDHG